MPHTGHSGGTARCGGSGSACPAEPPALALLRALSTAWQGHCGPGHCGPGERAGGDIEPSPAGGVHSSETAAAGETGPVGMETPQHLPRRGDTRAALAHHKMSRAGRGPQGSPAEDALRWVKASTHPGHPPRAVTPQSLGAPAGRNRALENQRRAAAPVRGQGVPLLCHPPCGGPGLAQGLSARVGQSAPLRDYFCSDRQLGIHESAARCAMDVLAREVFSVTHKQRGCWLLLVNHYSQHLCFSCSCL